MATPISYGLVLEGIDALDFEEYMKDTTVPKKGVETMREARRIRKEMEEAGISIL